MHGANLDHMSGLLALQNAVTTASRHSSDIQKLGAVDEVVVLSASDANAFCFDLEAEASLVLPQRGSHARLGPGRRDLARLVDGVPVVVLRSGQGTDGGSLLHGCLALAKISDRRRPTYTTEGTGGRRRDCSRSKTTRAAASTPRDRDSHRPAMRHTLPGRGASWAPGRRRSGRPGTRAPTSAAVREW
jgi:hypothetical protein